jgi:hypothetical protein
VSQFAANDNRLDENCCVKGNNDLLGTSIAKNPLDEIADGKLIRLAGGEVMP